jgi:hypothetical protein
VVGSRHLDMKGGRCRLRIRITGAGLTDFAITQFMPSPNTGLADSLKLDLDGFEPTSDSSYRLSIRLH